MIEMDFDAALKEMKEQDANDKASKAIYRAQGVNPDEYAQDMHHRRLMLMPSLQKTQKHATGSTNMQS